MKISATPDIAGNERAVERLREGLASAVAVAVADGGEPERTAAHRREGRSSGHDIVALATAETAPKVAELLETAIAERLARRRLYAGGLGRTIPPPTWQAARQRHRR